jgi:CHAD domain-containing protein
MKQFLIVQINQVFNAGEGLLANPTDPESLHQLRVQLRRLRSLFSFAKPLMKQEDYPFWQEQLSLWSHSMNSLRETDILSELWHTMAKAQRLSLSPTPGLGALVQSERTKLLDKLLATNTEKQFIPLLLNFWAWLSAEAWSSPVESQPFADFATSQLRDWVGGLRKSAKVLPFDNILELHHIRIQGKKLRYLLEILPHKDRKSKLLLARLKSLQDFAGEIHDTHATAALLALWLKQHTSRTIHRDAGLVLGWMAFANSDTESNAENAWQRFRRAARRWLQE